MLTTRGQALQAKVDAGQTLLTFTKMKIGSGVLSDGQNIESLTDLIEPQQNVSISGISASENITTITGVIINTGLATGFYVRELGLFAQDPDLGEILYSMIIDSAPDYLPPEGVSVTVSEEFAYRVIVSNTANVTAVINQNGLITASILSNALHLWQPNHAYAVGDICYSATAASYMFFECIQAGTTASIEPTWPAVGQEITDGTVRWRVRDIKSGSGVPIGTIIPFLATQVQPGWLACDTGALVSRATYPELWAWVQANAPLITEAEWQAQAAAQSSVGAYSSGDGTTTFRLPRIVDFVRGADETRLPGAWQADELQSHQHNTTAWNSASEYGYGATTNTGTYTGNASHTGALTATTGGDETRPKNIAMLYCVKAFDAATNQGLIDITELANEVAGKVNLTDFTGANQSLAVRGWQRLPGGLILQWGQEANTAESTGTVLFPVVFPNSCFVVFSIDNALAQNPLVINVTFSSDASFTWYGTNTTNGSAKVPDGWSWFAIGN